MNMVQSVDSDIDNESAYLESGVLELDQFKQSSPPVLVGVISGYHSRKC